MNVWFQVTDLDAARAFYREQLGFSEEYVDENGRWARLVRDGAEIGIAEDGRAGEDEVVAAIVVDDVKAEAERLREAGVSIGVVLEIPGAVRLLDVFDPDGNRVQLTEDL